MSNIKTIVSEVLFKGPEYRAALKQAKIEKKTAKQAAKAVEALDKKIDKLENLYKEYEKTGNEVKKQAVAKQIDALIKRRNGLVEAHKLNLDIRFSSVLPKHIELKKQYEKEMTKKQAFEQGRVIASFKDDILTTDEFETIKKKIFGESLFNRMVIELNDNPEKIITLDDAFKNWLSQQAQKYTKQEFMNIVNKYPQNLRQMFVKALPELDVPENIIRQNKKIWQEYKKIHKQPAKVAARPARPAQTPAEKPAKPTVEKPQPSPVQKPAAPVEKPTPQPEKPAKPAEKPVTKQEKEMEVSVKALIDTLQSIQKPEELPSKKLAGQIKNWVDKAYSELTNILTKAAK